jgi:hypothetical protein
VSIRPYTTKITNAAIPKSHEENLVSLGNFSLCAREHCRDHEAHPQMMKHPFKNCPHTMNSSAIIFLVASSIMATRIFYSTSQA